MATIEEVRSATQEARNLIEQKKRESQEIQDRLRQEKESLPNVSSQQALRGQKFGGGLQGRNVRQQVIAAEQDVSSRQGEVAAYNKEVLEPYEQQVANSEAQISDYDARQAAISRVVSAYNDKDGEWRVALIAQYAEDPYAKQYAKEFLDGVYSDRAFDTKLSAAVDQYNAGVPTEEAFKGLNLEYLKKKGLVKFDTQVGSSESVAAADKINNMFNSNALFNSKFTTQLPRSEAIKVNSKRSFFGSMIPLASAANSQTLNTNDTIESNGNNIRNTGISSGDNILVRGISRLRNIVGSGSDFSSNASKAEEVFKPKEIYSSQLGGFAQANPYTGQFDTSTAIVRTATIEEQKRMEEIRNPILKYVFNTDTKQGNLLTADLGRLRADKEAIRNINTNIDTLTKANVDKSGQWVGTEESFNKYQSNLNRLKSYGAKVGETITQPTIKVGLFGLTENVEISRVPTSTGFIDSSKAIAMTTLSTAGQFGRGIAEETTKGLPEEGYVSTNAQNVIVRQPAPGTMQYTPMGEGIYFKDQEVGIPEQRVLSKKQIGNFGEIVGKGAVYFTPYLGNAVFASEVAYAGKESNWNPVTFVKEYPSEAIGLATVGALKAFQGYRYITKLNPIIERVSIKAPVRDLRASQSVGKDIFISNGDDVANKVIYGEQKLSQFGVAGQRVVVKSQSKIGELFKRSAKIVYEGVPVDKVGRGKAIELLEGAGYSTRNAKDMLRYTAPKIVEQGILKGDIKIVGDKAFGSFETYIRQPVKVIDKKLGIKTKGSSNIKDITEFQRKTLNVNDKEIVLEVSARNRITTSKRTITGETGELSVGFSRGFSTEAKLNIPKAQTKDIIVLKEKPVSFLYSKRADTKLFPRQSGVSIDRSSSVLIKEDIDFGEFRSMSTGGKNVKTVTTSNELLKQSPKIETLAKPVSKKVDIVLDVTQDISNLNTPQVLSVDTKISKATQSLDVNIETARADVIQVPMQQSKINVNENVIIKPQSNMVQVSSSKIASLNIQNPKIREQAKLQIREIQSQQIKLATKQQYKQYAKQQLRTTQKTKSKVKSPALKTPLKIIVPTSSNKLQKLASQVGTDEFDVFVKKFGKDVKIKTVGSTREAKDVLVKELTGTLRASGFVERKGQKVSLETFGGFGTGFTRGKKDKNVLVQQRGFRLGRKEEVMEAQYFKKSKSRLGGFL
jgi:hypothetical protein